MNAIVDNRVLEFRNAPTLADILMSRGDLFPDRLAFEFLENDQRTSAITFGELDQSARAYAAALQQRLEPGSCVALVFPPGLDFVKAFFGCVYAGILAIPATYPKRRRPSARLSAIVGDARPTAILTTERVKQTLYDSESGELVEQNWLSVEELDAPSEAWQRPEISAEDVVFLQYTSGSTKDPRGVEVTHGNIAHNLEMIRQGFGLENTTANQNPEVGVCWLPAYHDMGLIGGILESLYVGGTTILMSPLSFLQRPARWLKAISDYGAVVSGAPNFAYELCLRKIKSEEMEGLDLSSWRIAFSGAEPIRAGTLRRFSDFFAPCGFSESSFYPCYGLAEATLLVTGGDGPGTVATCNLAAAELQEHGRAVSIDAQAAANEACNELVDCGRPLLGEEVTIVDPNTRLPCGENTVGEIWIRGQNVARGYRNRPQETEATFRAQLANDCDDTFLKSGDLGFLRDGSLFVTGRLKELLIIRGRNHYPHDLEATVQESHDKLIPGGGAAFLIDQEGEDLLVLVQEIERATTESQGESIIRDVRRNVTAEHDVYVHEVILIRKGTLPRTTSGKIRYAEVRRQYREDELSVISRWSFAALSKHAEQAPAIDGVVPSLELKQLKELAIRGDHQKLKREIRSQLMTWLAKAADPQDNGLDPTRPFADYGLDSLSAIELIGQLESAVGLKLSPTLAWTYPNPDALAQHIAELMTGAQAGQESEESTKPADDKFDQLLTQLEQMPEDEVAAFLAAQQQSEEATQ